MKIVRPLLLIAVVAFSAVYARGQRERVIPRPPEDSQQYGRRFFTQLRAVFGRFRDADLQRVFDSAQPVQCSELVNEPGEWRTVAFFNEKRELGDWYRSNFEEVKRDLSVFVFKGMCRGDHGPVQLTTKFPVTESVDAYDQGRITLDEVEVNVNAPVRASYDLSTKAYTFDLPFLFLVGQQANQDIYSLDPPRIVGRDRYAQEVTDHWDCKSVVAENVTYQFLICRTTTQPRSRYERNQRFSAPFGASAYFILSDGKEAASSVTLSFGDGKVVPDNSPPSIEPDSITAPAWEAPDSDEKLLNILRSSEFRIRFASQAWSGRIRAAQVLSGRSLSSLDSAHPPPGADYCVWLPGSGSDVQSLLSSDAEVMNSISFHDSDGQSSTSIVLNMLTISGAHLGSLQCTFPRVVSAGNVDYGRWSSIVGNNLSLEIRQ
jgi:hypothetical protein